MASKQIALLSYEFLFIPADTWSSVSQFEDAFAKFLRTEGMEGQVLDPISAVGGRKIVFIRSLKVPGVMGETPKAAPATVSPQNVIKKAVDPRSYAQEKK